MEYHTTEVRVRYQETDQMGVVYYSNYLVYFEIGRVEMLRSLGLPYTELEKEQIYLAVYEAYCKYKAPARYDDVLVIRTWVSKYKHAKMEISYEIWRENETQLVVHGSTTMVCLDANGKPLLIPKKLKDLFV